MEDNKSPETPALPAHEREAALPAHRPDPALPAPEGDGQREGGMRRNRQRNSVSLFSNTSADPMPKCSPSP